MIIEGNAPLAAAYAVNIIAIYQSYRWNAYVEAHRQDPKVWHGLVGDEGWQNSHLQGDDLAEIEFWLGAPPQAGASVAPVSNSAAVPRAAFASGPAPDRGKKAARPKRGSPRKTAKTAGTKKPPRTTKSSSTRKAPTKKKAKKRA
jgi:hypothetical protein